MKPSAEQLGNLLALKRDERPEEGYWQDFLCEFHQRQREASVRRWTPMGMYQRFSQWFLDLGRMKWLYGAGLGYAAIAAAFLTIPQPVKLEQTPTPVHHQIIPAPVHPVEQLDELDLAPSTQGSVGEQVF